MLNHDYSDILHYSVVLTSASLFWKAGIALAIPYAFSSLAEWLKQ
jgi:hypothetical protein